LRDYKGIYSISGVKYPTEMENDILRREERGIKGENVIALA
jgi:hypothetical protein